VSSAGPRDTLALFELEPAALEPGPAAAPPAAPSVPSPPTGRGGRRPRALPRDYAKLACAHACGWTHKARISRALDGVDEAGACPSCRRPAAVIVVGFVSR